MWPKVLSGILLLAILAGCGGPAEPVDGVHDLLFASAEVNDGRLLHRSSPASGGHAAFLAHARTGVKGKMLEN